MALTEPGKCNIHTIYVVRLAVIVIWQLILATIPKFIYANTNNHVYYEAMNTQYRPVCQTKMSANVHYA